MSLKTIFVGPLLDLTIDGRPPATALVSYAIELAGSQNAHLSVGVGSCKIFVTSAIVADVQGLIAAANEELRGKAEAFAAELRVRVRAAGVIGDIEVTHDNFTAVAQRFVMMSRLADVALLQPDSEILSLQKGLIEDVLFGSGRPIIVVPREWTGNAAPERILVAWDGSAKAARAIGDALPLLTRASEVEVVAVSGDLDTTKRLDGADIAPHLARHCQSVKVTQLSSPDGDIAAVLGDHARLTRANLLVMGAYAHARVMQIVLGGMTRSMIDQPPIPVFMSY